MGIWRYGQECGNYGLMYREYKVLHLGHKIPEFRINGSIMSTATEGRIQGAIISDDLELSKQCSKAEGKTSRILNCIGRGISYTGREVVISLHRSLVESRSELCALK